MDDNACSGHPSCGRYKTKSLSELQYKCGINKDRVDHVRVYVSVTSMLCGSFRFCKKENFDWKVYGISNVINHIVSQTNGSVVN